MRKRITGLQHEQRRSEADRWWLDLQQIATVEVTSEDPDFPIESALNANDGPGWRASEHGDQQIRIIFDEPTSLRRIELRFEEAEFERTQQFTLRWSPSRGDSAREIVRQQWNFSPHGSTLEVEDYAVDLEGVSTIELVIQPDVARRGAVATLASWRMG